MSSGAAPEFSGSLVEGFGCAWLQQETVEGCPSKQSQLPSLRMGSMLNIIALSWSLESTTCSCPNLP